MSIKATVQGTTVVVRVNSTATSDINGSTGATDNALLRANGAGGTTIQGSTVTLDDNGKLTNVDALAFDTTPTTTVATGTMVWESTEGVPEVGISSTISALLAGNYAKIYNNTGATLTKGTVVYVSGSSGTRLTVAKAQATTALLSDNTIGILAEDVTDTSSGFMQVRGLFRGLTTNSFTAGDVLWLSTTAGQITNVQPTAPNHAVRIGYCVKSAGAGAGSIYVDIQNGQDLDDIHDVTISAPASGDVLAYNGTVWINSPASSASVATGTQISGYWTSAPSGFVLANGGTIGSATSGADRANADTATLYALLWDNVSDTYCPVSTGRGANAAADFAANKTLTLPDMRERVPLGYKAAATIAGVSAVMGATLGEATHTLTEAELPNQGNHVHDIPILSGSISSVAGISALQGVNDASDANKATNSNSAYVSASGTAHNITQKSLCLNYAIKL